MSWQHFLFTIKSHSEENKLLFLKLPQQSDQPGPLQKTVMGKFLRQVNKDASRTNKYLIYAVMWKVKSQPNSIIIIIIIRTAGTDTELCTEKTKYPVTGFHFLTKSFPIVVIYRH